MLGLLEKKLEQKHVLLIYLIRVHNDKISQMRKILAFGPGRGFAQSYKDFFARNGFELVTYSNKANYTPDPLDAPVMLVFENELDEHEEKGLDEAMSALKKPQVIFVSGDGSVKSGAVRKAGRKAVCSLGKDFLKKDLATALASANETLSLREKVIRLQAELEQKSKELSSVLDVTSLLSSSPDFSKAINKIMERTRAMVNAQTWAIFLVDEPSGTLVFNAAKGVSPGRDARFRLKPGEGIAGWAMQAMEPKVVHDVSRERRFTNSVDAATGIKSKSVMAVPISVKGRLLGVAELINKENSVGFTAEDVGMVKMLMNQTALAVERSELYQRMEDLVITDDLTKLFNLRYLDRTLEVELERATRYNLSVSLIFMDIDYFKNVNDRYGHLMGSKLLVEVSQLLLKGLRKVDIVARYGGDEFVIVLPQTGIAAAKMIADRLRKAIEKHTFLKSENLDLRLTASFGIACYPEHASTQEDLLRLADEAMYRVKYHTRNDVYVVGT